MSLCVPVVVGAACPPARPVQLAVGASVVTLTGGIPRGERDCYTLRARQGRVLTIGQADTPDTNIVFQLYRPPWRIVGPSGGMAVGGAALQGAAEGDDARRFTGVLPVSGEYLLVIGTSRGSGEYRLQLGIR
jgi:hypothetical protein